jgi:hypothetical protein
MASELRRAGSLGHDAFFLTMAHWQLGEKDLSRKWYTVGLLWMQKQAATNPELIRFRAEAASLLGVSQTLSPEQELANADDVAFYTFVLEADPKAAWAHRIRGRLRPVDRVGIYGPNAVLVLLPECSADEAQIITSSWKGGDPALTCNLAAFPSQGTSVDELIAAVQQKRDENQQYTPQDDIRISAPKPIAGACERSTERPRGACGRCNGRHRFVHEARAPSGENPVVARFGHEGRRRRVEDLKPGLAHIAGVTGQAVGQARRRVTGSYRHAEHLLRVRLLASDDEDHHRREAREARDPI